MSYPIKTDAIIIAPTSEERQYTQNLLPQKQLNCQLEKDNKKLFYDVGHIDIFEKHYEIILISPEKAGPMEAQDCLSKVLEIWNPDLLIVTGVAGGYFSRKVEIGDLIIPLQITEFALFKDTEEGQEPRPDHFRVPKELVIAAKRFFDEKAEEIHETSNFENISCFSDGTILSSVALQAKEAVQKEAIKKLLDGDGKIYGIEQESSGIARVMENHREIKWIVVRCVMDLADEASRTSIKKDENKRLATELAAIFCFKFLEWYFKKVKSKADQKIQYLVKFLNNLGDLDIQSTSYDENDFCQTKKYSLDGIPKKFDMEGKCTYRDKKIPFFVDFNKKKTVNQIENEYKDFAKNSLSIWLNENEDGDWFARFIFISDHPCFCNEQFRFKNSIEFLKAVLADLDQDLLENFDENKTKIKTNFLPLLGLIYVTPDFYLLSK